MKIAQAVRAMFAALRCALCTLLIGIAALWAMPRSARAQLRVFCQERQQRYDNAS